MTTHLAFYLGRKSENPKSLLGDWLVCIVTKSRFSHVEILAKHSVESVWVDNKAYIGPVATMLSSSMREGGVREARKTLDPARWVVVEFDTDPKPPLAYVRSRIGIPYGWIDLLSFLLPWRVSWSGSDFCSEVLAEGFKSPKSWKTSPQDLFLWSLKQPNAKILSPKELEKTWKAL